MMKHQSMSMRYPCSLPLLSSHDCFDLSHSIVYSTMEHQMHLISNFLMGRKTIDTKLLDIYIFIFLLQILGHESLT